jgi:hypothetical protein
MKVEIERLDGSFGPFTMKMTAETDEDRETLSTLSGKVNMTSYFQARSWSGNHEPGTDKPIVRIVTFDEVPR